MAIDQDGPGFALGLQDAQGFVLPEKFIKGVLTHTYTVRDLERKKRLHEYRVAARREKRLRKSDEKKQRKLNATILRRMVSLMQAIAMPDH